jgi:hypothetical protein
LVLFCSACGSSSPADKLVGNWIYENADETAGIGATFRSDGTYTVVTLVLTSQNTGDAQVEDGSYVATDTSITTTPTEWTCPGPDPVSVVTYSFSGADLVATIGAQVFVMQPNNQPAQSSFALTLGCFDSTGNFTAQALAPVSNQ